MARALVFLALPCAVSGLRLRDGVESDFAETESLGRFGATMSGGANLWSPPASTPGAHQNEQPNWNNGHNGPPHHASDEEGNEWPDTWLHALEHGRTVAHYLDNQTLWDITHAKTGEPPFHYQAETLPIPAYNIPAIKMQHAVPGFQARTPDEKKRVTAFPSYLCLASSWDTSLVFEVAQAIAKEFKVLGANVMLGPAINIHRATQHDEEFDSLSGEDPTLGAILVRSWILATQTHGIAAVPKYLGRAEQAPVHFENSSANATAWDIYYPPILAAADTGAAGFMCATHEINGLWSCRDPELLVRDLRHMMSFHGMVLSDNNSAREYFPYASSFERGLDLEIAEEVLVPWSEHASKGMLKAAQRVIAAIWHMRFEQHPGCQPPNCVQELNSTATSEVHREIAKRATGSGVVLLKNEDNVLPIKSGPVAVIDATIPSSENCISDPAHLENQDLCMTPFDAIKSHGMDKGIEVTRDMTTASVCIVIGESSGGTNWRVDSATEVAIKLASTTCEYIVALLQTKGAVLTPWRYDLAGLAVLFASGENAAFSWACVVFGDCNPSGKLPISFPEKEEDIADWWNEQVPSYWDPTIDFAFPFGHGLSYASFSYDNFKDKPGCRAPLCIQLDVTNISPYTGQEVVQVYFKFGEQEHHPVVLRAFHKTKLLPPGDFERVFFAFSYRDLSLYHDVGNHTEPETSWHAEVAITMMIGSSSRDIRLTRVEMPRGV